MKFFLTTVIVLQLVLMVFIANTEEDKITDLEYNISVANTALMIDNSLKLKEIND